MRRRDVTSGGTYPAAQACPPVGAEFSVSAAFYVSQSPQSVKTSINQHVSLIIGIYLCHLIVYSKMNSNQATLELVMNSMRGALSIGAIVLVALLSSNTYAGCIINIQVKNKDPVRVLMASYGTQVKSKGGVWKKLHVRQQHIESGESISFIQNTTFRCSAKRRYRIKFVKENNTWVEYYPSANTWTTRTEFTVNAKR